MKPTTAIPERITHIRGASTNRCLGYPELLSLKVRVEEATTVAAYANLPLPRTGYNAVLCNLYRHGNDSVGLHADAEPEMGPVIASVSLGAERLFRLKRKGGTLAFWERLPHGSLFHHGRQHPEELQARSAQGAGGGSATHQPDVPEHRAEIEYWLRVRQSGTTSRIQPRP